MRLDTSTGWPLYDRQRGHIRTLGGSFIPFSVINMAGSIAAIVIGVEATFGITNWVSIPVAIATLGWVIEQVDSATIRIRSNEYSRRLENQEPNA